MHLDIYDVVKIVGFIISLIGFWNMMSSKITAQEQRLTKVEMVGKKNEEQLMRHQTRLDKYYVDNKIMLRLVEKVDALKEDIQEIKQKLNKE